ncbi:MAG: carbamoyltransferase HypF [Armatimonadota bacterium]
MTIKGIVQGVGFRPFVHQRARLHGIQGWVLNDRQGVRLEAEGATQDVERFVEDLRSQPPVLALIEKVTVSYADPAGYEGFGIRKSDDSVADDALCFISPDVATCPDCMRDVLDPEDRRYGYPFTNCTNCGPRFTIIEQTPYDRDKTTMAPFEMCADCQREYEDIEDRRYHAQPNACPRCGPQLSLEADGDTLKGEEALAQARRLLAEGSIVAVKRLGGFHLACDAENEAAVQRLRERKGREEKPLAIMCGSLERAGELCEVSAAEERLLTDPRRPITLLPKRPDCPIAEAVAPHNRYLGVFLPYTPLHALLFAQAPYRALVMTSGNISEEPLVHTEQEARQLLGPMADALLLHDRRIHARCDDSVVRVMAERPTLLRRSRGYAPFPIRLGEAGPTILACGAELKNTFCLAQQGYAFLSQHIGDLKNAKAIAYFEEEIEHFQQLFRAEPEIIAHDLHPQYLCTQYAMAHPCENKVGVQHHHAHIASCMAENGLRGPVIGVSFDGLGLGTDGTIWGGEFLVADLLDFQRAAHLRYVPMPGGDAAVREPWRMALAFVRDALGEEHCGRWPRGGPAEDEARTVVLQMMQRDFNSPPTSSCGRLFDAVAALVGLRSEVSFEGQAAFELEMRIEPGVEGRYEYSLTEGDGGETRLAVDTRPIICGVVEDVQAGATVGDIAARFHNTVIDFVVETVRRLAAQTGLRQVVLSGGCFQNQTLVTGLLPALTAIGLEPYIHHLVPPNDGGLSLGQAAVAMARSRAHTTSHDDHTPASGAG